jgi:hypothetical protein
MTIRTTTIDMARKRTEMAEVVADDLHGKRQGGLDLTYVGDYTVIDDGVDRWVSRTASMEEAIDEVVGAILDGGFDSLLDDADELVADAYACLCRATDSIYSREDPDSDLSDIASLDVDAATRRGIVEALGIEEEYEEYMASIS